MKRRQQELGNNAGAPRDDAARAVVTLCAGLLLAGCVQPLAVQDAFIDPFNGAANNIEARVTRIVAGNRALQAAGQACSRKPHADCPPEETVPPRPDKRALSVLQAWEAGEPRRPSGEHAGAF